MIRWWFFEQPLMTLRRFACKRWRSLKFLMWYLSKRWCSFAAWLINRWWSYEEFLIRFWFLMISMLTLRAISFFVLILKTLITHYRFLYDSVMMLWRDFVKTLIISMATFLIFIVFVVKTFNHWCFIAGSLTKPWWFFEETLTSQQRFRCKH